MKVVSGAVTADTWNHVVYVGDGASLSVYVNGNLVSKETTSGGIQVGTYTADLLLGSDWNNNASSVFSGHLFKGMMDEVRLYAVALTEDEVEALYVADTTVQGVQESDPYLKQDGTPAYGVKTAIAQGGKLDWMATTEKMPVVVTEGSGTLTMSNGAISRTFAIPAVRLLLLA